MNVEKLHSAQSARRVVATVTFLCTPSIRMANWSAWKFASTNKDVGGQTAPLAMQQLRARTEQHIMAIHRKAGERKMATELAKYYADIAVKWRPMEPAEYAAHIV